MVSYQAWVSIVFETLQDRGVEIDDLDDSAAIMRFVGQAWTDHGHRLKRMGPGEAREAALRLARSYS